MFIKVTAFTDISAKPMSMWINTDYIELLYEDNYCMVLNGKHFGLNKESYEKLINIIEGINSRNKTLEQWRVLKNAKV